MATHSKANGGCHGSAVWPALVSAEWLTAKHDHGASKPAGVAELLTEAVFPNTTTDFIIKQQANSFPRISTPAEWVTGRKRS